MRMGTFCMKKSAILSTLKKRLLGIFDGIVRRSWNDFGIGYEDLLATIVKYLPIYPILNN